MIGGQILSGAPISLSEDLHFLTWSKDEDVPNSDKVVNNPVGSNRGGEKMNSSTWSSFIEFERFSGGR